VIHERTRLSVLTSLITHPRGLIFNDLKQLCSLTEGNLSRHLRVLEAEGIVEIKKGPDHKRPKRTAASRSKAESDISNSSRRWNSSCKTR
jgi:DNA-binding MarR family transcriptional regulator